MYQSTSLGPLIVPEKLDPDPSQSSMVPRFFALDSVSFGSAPESTQVFDVVVVVELEEDDEVVLDEEDDVVELELVVVPPEPVSPPVLPPAPDPPDPPRFVNVEPTLPPSAQPKIVTARESVKQAEIARRAYIDGEPTPVPRKSHAA